MPNVHYNKNKIITFLLNTEHMTQKQPKKTIGYLRVSTDRQDLEKNKADILSFANQADLGRVVFVEEKASGKISWRNRKIVNILDDLGAEPPLVYRSQKSTETRRMTNGNSGNRFTPEIRARAVCLVLENEADYTSRTQAVLSIAKKIGCNGDTLRVWVRNHEIEIGLRNGVTQAERDELKILQRENKELRQANDILRKASAFFAAAELDRLRKK